MFINDLVDCTHHASILLSGKYDSSSFRQFCLIITTVSSNSQLSNEYSRGEPPTSCPKEHFRFVCISGMQVIFRIKCASHYSASTRRSFLRSSHGPRSAACQEPEADRRIVMQNRGREARFYLITHIFVKDNIRIILEIRKYFVHVRQPNFAGSNT